MGLYMNPPDKAMVLCVDERSQIQALDRTQPGLPILKKIDPRRAKRDRSAPDHGQLRHPQTAEVKAWLAAHPRFKSEFIPTSSSWLAAIDASMILFQYLLENFRVELFAAWEIN